MGFTRLTLALVVLPATLEARRATTRVNANPIRKVVQMLQMMQTKVSQEGDTEKALYDKFACFCKTNGGSLTSSIESANDKIPAVTSDIKSSEELKAQTSDDLSQAQQDRDAAKTAVSEATAIREKEAAAFAAFKGESDANIDAINKAVAALEKGMAGAFLQSSSAQALKSLVMSKISALQDYDRQAVLSFLEGSHGSQYAPQSGEITGILKQLGDEMGAGLSDATATENAAIKTYEALMAAKKKEVAALSASIESKMTKMGELGVSIEQMKNDLGDTQEALLADQGFLANLKEGCTTKKAEWEERVKTRADELMALADTIKVLNDDDALELFKKTLPSPSASFVQVSITASVQRARALEELRKINKANRLNGAGLDLIALALHGKKVGFDKVTAMIDDMVASLKTEQSDDDNKKEYCAKQLDQSDDKKKSLQHAVADQEAAIEGTTEHIATVTEEIAKLNVSIKALDKAVSEATEQRKLEHEEFTELMASDSAAKEVLGFAKNRLKQFYNPKLYRPPAKRELSAEDRIFVNNGGTPPPTELPGGIAGTGIKVFAQISAHNHAEHRDAPLSPPETFGAYTKKSEMNNGVVSMMDLLIKDLDKEMTEAETEEKDAQADYEILMKDSADKRGQDSKSLTDKSSAKADLQAQLEDLNDSRSATGSELAATLKYIHQLHLECDWLLEYFNARKEARADEIDALRKAKAVLAGADYALL